MSLTGPISIQASPPVASGPPAQKAAAGSAPTGGPPPSPAAAPAPPPPLPAPIGFTLHYDEATQRLILEARDPVSGFVIYQIPPQTAFQQFAASGAAAAPARGNQHDDQA